MEKEKSGLLDPSTGETLLLSMAGPKKIGQWLRRRCLDGALNRVPADFYSKMWHLLERCECLSVEKCGFYLEHRLTQEVRTLMRLNINAFIAYIAFLYPMETTENLWFTDIFRGYRNGAIP